MTETAHPAEATRAVDARARSARTRRTLLAAAAELINAERTASIKDLIDGSGVTRGGVYFHFESKADLIRGVIDDADDQIRVAYAPAAAAVHGHSAAAIVEDFVDRIAANPILHATCLLWTDHDFAVAARAATRAPLRAALINALTAAAGPPRRDPVAVADLLLAVLTAHTATAGEGVTDPHVRAAVLALTAEILR